MALCQSIFNDRASWQRMHLYLIRHAESENNARAIHERVEDPSITELGRLQSECLANWTKTLTIGTLITSPFLRTLQTTRAIVDATPQPVHIWHNVYERGGCYRGYGPDAREGGMGLGRTDILRHASASPDACVLDATIDDAGWWGGKPREQDHEVKQRAELVAKRLVDTFGASGETIVAVIHAEFKRWLLAELIGESIDPHRLGPMRNTGITKVNFNGQSWQLDWFNSVSHMPARLITGHE